MFFSFTDDMYVRIDNLNMFFLLAQNLLTVVVADCFV